MSPAGAAHRAERPRLVAPPPPPQPGAPAARGGIPQRPPASERPIMGPPPSRPRQVFCDWKSLLDLTNEISRAGSSFSEAFDSTQIVCVDRDSDQHAHQCRQPLSNIAGPPAQQAAPAQQQPGQAAHGGQTGQQPQLQQQPHRVRREDENSVVVRGTRYTKLECVGRGGSSKVAYRDTMCLLEICCI